MTQEYGLRFKVDSRDVKKAQADVDSLGRKAGDTERRVTGGNDRMSRSFGNLAAKVTSLSIVMGLLGGASLGAVIRQAADFEATMSSVQAVTRATNDEMKNLSATARQLGATTMFSASQAAEGMKFLGMAGFNTRQIMAAMPATLSLAAAGGLGLAQAADIASNSLSGFGIAAEQMGRVSDVLAAAASRSNTSVAQLGDALSYAAPSARTLGVSIEETVAAIGALSDAGIQSSRAGTGLAGVFRQLTNITTEGEKVLKAYGLSVQDVDIKSNGLGKVLSTVASKNLSAGDAIKLFGAEAGVAAQVLLAATGRVDELTVALNGAEGEAKRMADTMVNNLTGDVTKASSALGELALKVNDASGVKDGLRVVVQALTKAITENDTELAKVIASLGYAIGSLAALTTLIWGATAATAAWNAALRLNPIIMAGTLFVGALAGITKYNNETERAKDVTQRLAEAESRLADAKNRVQMAQRSPSLMRPAQEELRRSTEAVKALREEIKVKDEAIKQGLDKIVVEVLAEEAARDAAEAVANLAAEESKRIRLTEDQIKAQKKAAEEYARAQQVIADAIESVADKVAKFNMSDSEAMMFDFDKLAPSPEQTARMAGFVEQFALLKQAEDNAKFAMDQYEESVKKADQTVADFLGRDIGLDLSAGFDAASQSIGQFVNAFEAVIDQQAAFRKAILEAGDDQIKVAKINQAQARAQVKQYGDMVGAAKGFFKEGSKGYKSLQAAEQVYRAFQLVQSAKVLAAELFALNAGVAADTFATGVKVGNSAAEATASGIAAQAKALASAPPPANFAFLATVTAALIGIGVALRGGGGSAPAVDPGNTGTGTVFGDPEAKSESIAKSIEQLEKSAGIGNRISSQMLNSLRNIEANIGGLTNLILRNGGAGEGLANGIAQGTNLSAVGNLVSGIFNVFTLGLGGSIGKALGGLFGKTKTTVKASGLFAGPQSLDEILGGNFNLQEYVDVQIKKSSLFGSSTKNRTQFSAADDLLERQFSLIIGDFVDVLKASGDPLGVNLSAIESALSGFVVNIGKIDLRGLKGAEIEEKLSAVFGSLGDQMAEAVFPGLRTFQQVGEGLLETVVRVASGIEVANNALDQMGVTAINYAQILRTQGDVATEIIRQSVVMADTSRDVAGGFAEIVNAFDGTAEDIIELITTLRDLQSQLRAVGQDANFLTVAMINGAGGVDGLQRGLDAFFDMLEPAEQLAAKSAELSKEFNQIGQLLPASIADYRALAEGIDISTEAGQKLYGQVIALAPAFQDLTDLIEEEMQRTIGGLESSITGAMQEIRQAVKDAENDLRAAYQRQARDIQQVISQFTQLADTLAEFRKEIGRTIGEAAQGGLLQARAEFASIGSRAMLGDQDAMRSLPEVGRRLEQASAGFAASREEYIRDLTNLQRTAASAEAVAGRQKTIAEQQLDALNLAVSKLIDIEVSQLTVATIRSALEGLGVDVPAMDALIQAADLNADGIIDALEAGRISSLAAESDNVARLQAAITASGNMTAEQVRQSLAGKATDTQIADLIRAVDTNGDGQITSAEINAARLIAENQALQNAVSLVGSNTQSVEQATNALQQIQSVESQTIEQINAAGFGQLVQGNNQVVSALERANQASESIRASINTLVDITAQAEQDRLAEMRRQQAEVERLNKIKSLQEQGGALAGQVATSQTTQGGIGVSLESLTKQAYSLASKYGVAINAKSGAVNLKNDAVFGLDANGNFQQQFGQISFSKSISQAENFKKEFYAAGGLYDQIKAQAAAASTVSGTLSQSQSQLDLLRQQVLDLGGVPGFATGGMHSGGWRVVGENGPELEYTGPSRIFNANQSASMVDQSGVEQRLERLEQIMMRGFHAVEKNTGRTAEQLRRWDDGDRMNVAIDTSDSPVDVRSVA